MAYRKLPDGGFFEKHADKIAFGGPDDCWLWTAGTFRGGYGQIRARDKKRGAHREAYENVNGIGSADGLVVRHMCDTPRCVNPAHLEIGTYADNTRDMMERGRGVTQRLAGETNGNAKLTEDAVREIRAAYISGSSTHSQRAIARQFGVTHPLIGKVVRREIWAHV